MNFVQKVRYRKVIATPEKRDNVRYSLKGPGDTYVSLGFFTSEWSSKQRVCAHKHRDLVREIPETL